LHRIFSREPEAHGFVLKSIKVVPEGVLAKRINLLQTGGADHYSISAVAFFLEDIKKLASRGSIEIACPRYLEIVVVTMHGDSKIGCRDVAPFCNKALRLDPYPFYKKGINHAKKQRLGNFL